jgi:hypothetical protein
LIPSIPTSTVIPPVFRTATVFPDRAASINVRIGTDAVTISVPSTSRVRYTDRNPRFAKTMIATTAIAAIR